MKKLSELPIKPLRLAFDSLKLKEVYTEKVKWAAEFGIYHLSNYILYNFKDTPEDFYARLRINIELNEELGTSIYSFPMKYIPVKAKNRKYIGPHWNKKYLRGIQCILNATHGVVGTKKNFFNAAFGEDITEFKKLLLMPDDYIIFRKEHANNGAKDWNRQYRKLSTNQKGQFIEILSENNSNDITIMRRKMINKLLEHYA